MPALTSRRRKAPTSNLSTINMTGLIIKIVSNQYTLLTREGESILATAMGKLRLGSKPLVGDRVEYELIEDCRVPIIWSDRPLRMWIRP